MNLETLQADLNTNLDHLATDLAHDLKAEVAHVIDPSQCGVVVQGHFDALVFTLLAAVAGFLATSVAGILLFS